MTLKPAMLSEAMHNVIEVICMNEEMIAIEELKQKMNEICQKCPDGKSEWCGNCHFDELAEVLGIKLYWQDKKGN